MEEGSRRPSMLSGQAAASKGSAATFTVAKILICIQYMGRLLLNADRGYTVEKLQGSMLAELSQRRHLYFVD